MVYSVFAKNKATNEGVQLLVDNSQLIIEHKTSSTVETKEIFDLEFIYGINFEQEILSIRFIEKEKEIDEGITNSKKTLTSIRPQDIKWCLRTIEFISNTDNKQQLSVFVTQLQHEALPNRDQLPKTKVVVVLNPTSGLQLATKYWESIVQPMFVMGGFKESNIIKVITESDGKTRGLIENLAKKFTTNTIIVSMGGDGTLYEIVNGLLDASPVGNMRLGIIPVGSGNAFALGINIESIEQATARIIQGKKEEPFYMMDVKFGHSNHTENKWQDNIEYDVTKKSTRLLVVMSWGFHAQIVSKSRYLRYFMGNKRFSLVAMFLLKFLQQYPGELILKDAKKYSAELESFIDINQDILLDDAFTYFIASKQPSLEKGFNIAPFASPLKKEMDVVLLRRVDSETLTKASIGAFQGGIHVNSEQVEYYKTSDLLLRVKHKAELCLDGEIYDLPVNGVVHLKVIGSSTVESNFTVFV